MKKEEIIRIADLARIELDKNKIDEFTEEFNKILEYFKKLSEVNTDGISPFEFKDENTVGEDNVVDFKDGQKILENAPARQDDYFKVRKVIE